MQKQHKSSRQILKIHISSKLAILVVIDKTGHYPAPFRNGGSSCIPHRKSCHTPASSSRIVTIFVQGLAPHHDDVEIFVCQTEGTKRWRLYKPRNGFSLPNQPSGDLKEEELSEPIMDITLKVCTPVLMPLLCFIRCRCPVHALPCKLCTSPYVLRRQKESSKHKLRKKSHM